ITPSVAEQEGQQTETEATGAPQKHHYTLNQQVGSITNVKKWQIPRFINTDKAPAYGRALALLKREGRCPSDV
ncbi:hypothetical protein M2C11_28850, partial [Klebsiella pneumoniae]|nr:hypothetical protein [Klebsiella pneumoniae]MDZ3208729.1 hypothetical protein [Klebsiella pneumoniae]